MLDIGKIRTKVPARFRVPNMLLLAGAGQNVGKTSFAVDAIKHLKKIGHVVYALKITPHFHSLNPSHLIFQTENYQISLEKELSGNKDSSRMLDAGADEVFFVQTRLDGTLPEAFDYVLRMAKENVLWVCESGGLRSYVDPGLFLYFKLKGEEPQKSSAKRLMPLADKVVVFDGSDFDFLPEQICVSDYQFKLL